MNKELNAAEAVYGFVGWLTSREERTVMSAKDDCAPIAELIKRFCTENNLPEVSDQWPLNLIHPSGEVAVPNAEIALLKRSLLDAEAAAPQPSTTAQSADSVPEVEREQERIAFKDAHRHLELDEVPDAWGRPMFKHSHIEASWLGWIARASHGQAPAWATLPDGWVPLMLRREGQYPEEVAYGPPIMMDRLGRWLGKYFDQAAQADSAQEDAHALLQDVAACFTRDDDLPDNLLPRIDAVLAARKQGEKQ